MVRVQGHWREFGWVRAHLRHPHRPGEDQVGLVLLTRSPIRLDPVRAGAAPSSPLPGHEVTVPEQRTGQDTPVPTAE